MAVAFLTVASYTTCAPLNPAYRASEFDMYLTDLHAKVLIVPSGEDSPARAVAQARGMRILELSPVNGAEAGLFTLAGEAQPQPSDDGYAQPEDVALVLHTSGTTSRPKIVPLTHANICTSARHIADTLGLGETDRCLNIMPLFHIHGLIAGTLASLIAGSSVVCPPGFYAPQFFPWLDECRPTWYTAVPTMHQAILARAVAPRASIGRCPLRFIRSSSAPLSSRLLTALEETFNVPVIEAYGMTEASHQMASNPLPPQQRKPGSVGVAAGPEIAIMDAAGNLLPQEARGEIVIRGANVMPAYENNPAANAQAFTYGWFRTGDSGFLDAAGYLFITGRLKEVINRGGEKIAPREVEDVLLEHPAVAQAVVFPTPHAQLGEEVAAAVVLQEQALTTASDIRAFVATSLADYKVPRHVLIVKDIPQGPTGKLQRLDLAAQLGLTASELTTHTVAEAFVAPRRPLEVRLAELWSQVLGAAQVGLHDNFFALGGDSILAAQILSRLYGMLQVQLSFLTFVETPTIAGMVKDIMAAEQKVPTRPFLAPRSGSRPDALPLSYAQQRLWFLEQLDPGNYVYNRPAFWRFTGTLNVAVLERCINNIVKRHDVLRTTFANVNGQPIQRLSPPQWRRLPVVDLGGMPQPARLSEAQRLAVEEAQRSFDLAQGPLWRATLLRLHETEYLLLLTLHHIVFDGWSEGVVLQELLALYNAFSAGEPSPLSDLPMQYADFATWQQQWLQGEVRDAHLTYWRTQLAGAPAVLQLPTDRPRPAVQTFQGAREPLALSTALTRALKTLSQRQECTLFMTLLAAFQALLCRYSGQEDISVGTFNANRPWAETEGLIGFFINNLVFRTDLSGDPSFRELLGRVCKVTLGAYAYQNLPFEQLLEALQPQRSRSHTPLFQVMLVLQNTPRPSTVLPGLTVSRYLLEATHRSHFDVTLWLSEEHGTLVGALEYSTDLFDAATICRMREDFCTLLEDIVTNPEQRLSACLPGVGRVDSPEQRAQLVARQAKLSAANQTLIEQRLHGTLRSSATIPEQPQRREPGRPMPVHQPIAPRPNRDVAPMSFAQQRLWFLDQLEPHSAVYNIPYAVRWRGSLNVEALQQTLSAIVARHETLRTTFVHTDGEPVQCIATDRMVDLPVLDLRAWPQSEQEAEVRRLLHTEAQRPFNLTADVMLRATLLRLQDEEYLCLLVLHHIAADGWSLGILFREIAVFYDAFCTGKLSSLPPLPIQYADYAVWQQQQFREEKSARQLAYWKQQLADLPMLEIPTDYPRPPVQTYHGAWASFALPRDLSTALNQLSRRERCTLFMTLLAAFQTLLSRYTGQDDVAVGSPIAGRTRVETEGLIGFFVNTLVLRADLSGNPTFRDFLHRVREVALEAYTHQDLPFEKLVEELQPTRVLNRNPLFQALLTLQNAPMQSLEIPGLTASFVPLERVTAKFDLSLSMTDTASGLTGSLAYNTDLFAATTIQRLIHHWQSLLEGIVAHPEQPIAVLPLLTPAEQQQLLIDWQGPTVALPPAADLHMLFEIQATQTPEQVAVVCHGSQITYRELNRRANQLAHRLQALGVGPDILVGICLERCLEMVIGLLAILKAGGAYVPLDPAYPRQRLAAILAECQPRVLLTQQRLVDNLPAHGVPVLCLDTDWEASAGEDEGNPVSGATADHLAYVIYTSGSTGAPKGVMVARRSLRHYAETAAREFTLTPEDRLLQFASLSFDAAVEEIFPCLIRGATLVLRTEDMVASIAAFVHKCDEWQVTVLDLPTAYWHELTTQLEALPVTLPQSVRLVIIGGEKARGESLRSWQQQVGYRVRLINTYGPTETTVVATMCDVSTFATTPASGDIPIGRAIRHVQTFLLDRHLQLVPIGVPGELYIGGIGVARGYLNRPELTAEHFVPHPFSHTPGTRLYKTGDLGRYLPDGRLEFLGRVDHQVKLRGFRVELGEIETVLEHHSMVRQAVVTTQEVIPGGMRLVAYVVPDHPSQLSNNDLHHFVQEKLPAYMVPAVFVILDALPLTPSGKVDRRALPTPERTGTDRPETFLAPRTPVEKQVAQIWADVLHLENVGLHDNFFALGGHSLLATQINFRLHVAFPNVDLPLRLFFETPTVAGIALAIVQHLMGQATHEDIKRLIAEVEELSDDPPL